MGGSKQIPRILGNRIGFLEAGAENSTVRPAVCAHGGDILNQDEEKSEERSSKEMFAPRGQEEEENQGEEEEEEAEEGRIIKGQSRVVKPSKEEWDNHMRTHIPYRKWCPHCVRGKKEIGWA